MYISSCRNPISTIIIITGRTWSDCTVSHTIICTLFDKVNLIVFILPARNSLALFSQNTNVEREDRKKHPNKNVTWWVFWSIYRIGIQCYWQALAKLHLQLNPTHNNFASLFLSSLWSDLSMWGHFLIVLNLSSLPPDLNRQLDCSLFLTQQYQYFLYSNNIYF